MTVLERGRDFEGPRWHDGRLWFVDCLERDGAVWVASFSEDAFVRIDRDGQERQRIAGPGRRAIACALGGEKRTTLFCLSAATSPDELEQRKSAARIDVVEVETPGAGYP
jgi:sugar lactone lactonase YvrE